MKKNLLLLLLSIFQISLSYSQLALYNTRTLYDTFENPSQKAFYADSSKKYAFNFLIPTFSFNGTATGEAQTTLKKLIYDGKLNAQGLTLGEKKLNKLTVTENSYLAMFKIFKTVKFHREVGFAWQIKSDTYAEVPNETITILHDYKLFGNNTYINPFNSYLLNQNYHQLSFTYREDYNKRLGLGVKVSYLSGIAHTKLKIDSSSLHLQKEQNSYNLSLYGKYKSSAPWDSVKKSIVYPGLKNPGFALSLSANYKLRGGWYILGNLKDLGFIRWKSSESHTFSDAVSVTAASASQANSRLRSELNDLVDDNSTDGGYTTMINGKAEFLINKEFGGYQPSFLISKNLFYKGGDIALINRLRHRAMNVSLTTAYNLNNFFQLGTQFMIKSPNAEFFIGSDQILKSYYTTKGLLTSNEMIGKGNTAASFYFGLGFKFGSPMQRQQNATIIPGIESEVKPGFFQRIFKKKTN